MTTINDALSVLNRLDEFYKGLLREHEALKGIPVVIKQIDDITNRLVALKKDQEHGENSLRALEARYANRNTELHQDFVKEKARMDLSIQEKMQERAALEQQISVLQTEFAAHEATLLTRTAEIEQQVKEKEATLQTLRTEVDSLKQRLGVV